MATLASNNRVNEKRKTITIDYDRFLCLRSIVQVAQKGKEFLCHADRTKLDELFKQLQKLEVQGMVGVWNQS